MNQAVKNFYSKFKYSIKYMVALGIFIAMIGFVGEHCLRERYKRKVAREKYFMKTSNEDVFIIEDE